MIVLLRTVIARVKTFYEKLSQPFSCELLAVYFQNLLGEKFPNLMLVVSAIYRHRPSARFYVRMMMPSSLFTCHKLPNLR